MYILCAFDLVTSKVILASCSAFSIFRNLDLTIRDRKKHFARGYKS